MDRLIAFTCFFMVICGCASLQDNPTHTARETVLSPGMKLCAEDKGSHICILAEENNKRIIILDGKKYSIYLKARKERWNGVLGLYTPRYLCKDGEITTTVIAEEAQIHGSSIEATEKSLMNPFNRDPKGHMVYRDDGLKISWTLVEMTEKENILKLDISERFINGKKPDKLSGSHNNKICIGYVDEGDCK